MKIRLYGGPGHGRMVYIPGSVTSPPEEIAMPVMTLAEHAALAPLDPELGNNVLVVKYVREGTDDADGYARYTVKLT